MKKLTYTHQSTSMLSTVKVSNSLNAWSRGLLLIAMVLFSSKAIWAQTFSSVNAPGILVSCTTQDTMGVTILNNSGGPLTNLRFVPLMAGYRYVSTVANANLTVLNSSATAPVIQINSLAAGASQNIKMYMEAGCSASTGSITLEIRSSANALIATQASPIMTVYKPTVSMTGLSNTSISPSNETSVGLLSNLVNGQTIVKGFSVTSNNSSAPLDEVRVYVLNTNKYWQPKGVAKGTMTILGTGDTIMYTFGPAAFATVGDGDGLFESTDGAFTFTDTMKLIACNSDVTTATSLKYFAAWGCFAPPAWCDKSSDVDAYANVKAANDNILISTNPLNYGLPKMCGNSPTDTTAKSSFRILNSNVEGSYTGSGTIYDVVIRLGRGDFPFQNDTNIGNQNIKILAAKVNGIFVPFTETANFGIRIANLTAAQYTGGGLTDEDGDGFFDELKKDSSVIVELFCNFRPGVATTYYPYNTSGGNSGAYFQAPANSSNGTYGYMSTGAGQNQGMLVAATQWKCNITYQTPCRDKKIIKSAHYLYSYMEVSSMGSSSSVNPDFFNNTQNTYSFSIGGNYNYLNSLPRSGGGSQYADSMISEFMMILPPGINLDSFDAVYGNPGAWPKNRVYQAEINGPGDYDTAIVRYARKYGGNGTEPFRAFLRLDCSQLTNQCPNQDTIKWYSKQLMYAQSGDATPCFSTIIHKGFRPMRYKCPSYFKGLKMTAYDNKRMSMGSRNCDATRTRIDPNSAFANSDSVERNYWLTYDTVLMAMKGVMTDTALGAPYVKVNVSKLLNSFKYNILPHSRVRIYDASTATYRSFALGAKSISSTNSYPRDLFIPLAQYVDSMRAFDPTFLLGGNVGSSVYSSDSVFVDMYYKITNSDADSAFYNGPNVQTYDHAYLYEIESVAEYRNDTLTAALSCNVFSEYNNVLQHGYNTHYSYNSAKACNQGYHQLQIWPTLAQDYFPNEDWNNNKVNEVEFEYDLSKFHEVDSILFTYSGNACLSSSYTRIPASSYTQTAGKIVIKMDSLMTRNQQKVDQIYYWFQVYQMPTCGITGLQSRSIAETGVTKYKVRRDMHVNANFTTPIFGTKTGSWYGSGIPDPIAGNQIVASSNPSSVNVAQKDTLEWIINFTNSSTTRFNYAWMDFRSPGVNIVKVTDITGGANINKPVLTYFSGDLQQWVKADSVKAGETRQFKIFATLSGCNNDTLKATLGYNCKYYPVDPQQGYLPPFLYGCSNETVTLNLPVSIPPVQLQWAKISETPPSPISLCDTITYTSRISNLNLSNLSQVKLNVTLPTASNLTYVTNSGLLQWPEGSSYLPMGVTPTISGGIMTFDLSSKFKGGVLQNSLATGDSNKSLVILKFVASCPFASGDQIPGFGITAKQPCGNTISGDGHTSQVLRITGVPVSPATQLQAGIISMDTLGVCGDTSTIRFRVYNRGGAGTTIKHAFTWEMPQDINLVTGSTVVSVPARLTSTAPTNTVIGSARVLKWSMSATAMPVNDSLTVTFKAINTNSFSTCGSVNGVKLQTLESYAIGASCAPGGVCDVNFIVDTKTDTIKSEASRFALSNLVVSSVPNPPFGETVAYSVTLTNNGEAYTGNYNLKFYGNTTTSDSIGIRTVSGGLAKGASITLTGTVNAPAGKACNLRVKLDSTGCFCSYPSLSAPYNLTAALKDSTICSGVTLPLGLGAITGYSYFWNDGSTTSSINKTFVNTDPNNNRIDTNRLVIDRMGCTYTDTTITTVKPVPQALDITADNTCLLTNPITFTASSTSSGVTYGWTFPGGATSTANPTDRAMTSGVQNVIINATKNGCAATYNESFTFYDLNISATPDNAVICYGTSTALRANSSNATNFQWYSVNRTTGARIAAMGTAPTQSTGNLTDTARFRVVVTNGTCTDSSDATVAVISNVVVGRVDTTICPGQPVVLSVPFTFNTANWTNLQNGATSSGLTYAVSPTVTTMFRVVAQSASPVCTAIDTVYVTVRAVTLPVISGVRSICSGASSTYTAAPTGTSPVWSASTGSITSGGVFTAPSVTSTTAAVLTYTHTDVNGCVVTDTHNITINPLPVVSITNSNASMCSGQTRTLSGTPSGGTFSGTGVAAGVFTAPATAGNYVITYSVTDANGCIGTSTQSITVNAPITLTAVTFSPGVVCNGSTTSASATPAGGTWSVVSGPGTINAGTGLLTTSGTALITVRYSHPGVPGASCANTIDGTITPVAKPIVAPSASPATICNGSSSTIAANAAGGSTPYTYAWSAGSGASHTASPTSNTTYNVTVTDNNSCTASGSVTLTVTGSTPLAADAGTARAICNGASTTLGGTPTATGGAGGYTYAWSNSAGTTANPVVSPTATTTYTVTVTSSSCTVSNTVVVTVNPKPSVAPSATPTTLCNGQSTTVAANATGGTAPLSYTWTGGGSGASFTATPSSTTSYLVTVSDANTCTASGSVTVNVTGTSPLVASAGTARTICSGVSTTLGGTPTGSGGSGTYTYSWSGGASAVANPTVSPTATTTYTVTVTSSGCTATSTVIVTVNPTPTIAPSASASTICNGQSVTISANAAGGTAPLGYTWNIGSGASHSHSPTANTTYQVTTTDASGCSASGSVTVNVTGSTPLAADAGTARAICNGASTTLGGAPTATGGAGGYTYSWSNSAGTTANPVVSPTATTTYTVTVTSSSCTVSNTVVVTVNPKPSIAPSATPATICNGQSTTIAANATGGTAPLAYTWTGGGSGASFTASPSSTTSYAPTVSDANGCSATGTVTVNVTGISPLIANAGTARTICSGVSTSLGGVPTATGGSGGYTYTWSGGASAVANPTVSPTATTTYTVTVTSSGCTATSTVIVTVNPTPTIAPSASATTICNGESVTINANAAGGTAPLSYTWNNGTGASHVKSPTANTTYLVTVSDANSCTATGSVSVTVTGSTPLASNAGTARAICNGASTTLGGTPTATGGAGGYTYSWSNGAGTTANPVVSPTATTTYTLTVTSSGCTVSSSVIVTVNPKPSVAPSATPAALCNGESTTIAANATGGTAPLTYVWGTGSTASSFTATPSTTSAYALTVTDANGCTASGSITVNVTGTSPLVAVAGSARAICDGSSTTLGGSPTASGGAGAYTYNWSGGAGNAANPVVSPTATTTYTVTVTSSGCTASNSVIVTVNPRPNVAPSTTSATICNGSSTTVSANATGGTGTITYQWSPSGSGASFTPSPTATTIFNVTATDANSCTATGSVSVSVTGSSPLTANAGTNRTVCSGTPTNLGGAPTGNGGNTSGTYTYSWSNGAGTAANPTVSPTTTTTYTVTVTNTLCTATSSVIVTVNPKPVAAPTASANPVCSGSNTTIAANPSGGVSPYTYQWNTSQTSASFVATPTSTVAVVNAYTVTVTDVNNCTVSATINVNVTPLPVMTAIANQSVCIPATGGKVTLSAAALTAGQTGAWTAITSPSGAVSFTAANSASTDVNTVSPINTYTFRWTITETGCSNWTNTNVTVNESPVIEAGMNDTICLNTSKALSASLTSVSPAAINWKANTISATPFAFTTGVTVAPTTTTRYIFTAAISPCIVSDTVVVAVIGVPDLVNDLTTCLSATEDVPTTYNISTTIGTNDALGLVLRGGVTYKVLSSKNSVATVSGTTLNYASNLNFYGKDTVIIEAYSNECTPLRDTAMFCVDVAGVNDKPTIVSDSVKAIGTNPKTFNPLANDSDIETTLKGGNITVLSGPNSGTLTGPAADGTFTYTGNSSNLAILDTITYQVCDSGLPMPAQCEISTIIVQLVPDVKDSIAKVTPGTPVTIGTPITTGPGVIMSPKLIGANGTSGTTITTPSGVATINPTTGVLTFTPNDTPFIGKDTIRRVLCFTYPNGSEACDTSIFVVSNPSVTNTSSDSTPMNTPKVVGSLKPYKFEGGVATMTTTPNAKVDPVTGAVTYTPKPGFVGVDTVKVTRCDSKGNCVTDVMVVKVTPNLPDTNVTASGKTPVTLGPAIKGENGTTVVTTLVGPKKGTATTNADGTITYTPSGSYVGRDTITRIVKVTYPDGTVKYDTQTVIVKNTLPDVVNPDGDIIVKQDEKKDIGTLPVVTFEGSPVTTTITSSAGGTATVDSTGKVTYTPKPGYSGMDTIKIVRCDNLGNCVTSIFIVKVEEVVSDITNYLSPNGDGVNDVWNLDGLLNRYPNAKAIIYNRWGNVVWRSTGPYGKSTTGKNIWSGQVEGSSDNVPDGVYYYLLELEDEFKTTKTGFIEIMRQ